MGCAMRMNFYIIFGVLIVLGSCASVEQTFGPDGRIAHAINCSDSRGVDMNACYVKAGEICGSKGYDVINKETDKTLTAVLSDYEGLYGSASSENNRMLLISCK